MIEKMVSNKLTPVVVMIGLMLGFVLAGEAFGVEKVEIQPASACDFETLTVTSSTPLGLTASKLSPSYAAPPKQIFITVETTNVRFRIDGTDPDQTTGHLIATTSSGVTIKGWENLAHLKFIGIAAGSTVQVTYER